jgi:SAM-dependent methyltransferase
MKIDFDFATDHPCYRPRFPDELFERLAGRYGLGIGGQRVLDIGTGTGTLARAFARRGCFVTAVDPSAEALTEAKRLAAQNRASVDWVQSSAEETGLPSDFYDVVSAGQTWHWFDRPRAAAEARRVTRPGGHLVIIYVDWLSLKGNINDATEEMIERHNPAWRFRGWSGFNPLWTNDASEAGFVNVESFSFDVSVMYSHEYWRGRVRDSAGLNNSLSPAQLQRFDDEMANMLRTRFSSDPMPVPHRVFAIVGRAP